ncbi:hypothetical protein KFE25_009903 [Diacronema lutheri]|uniref:Uncharacterized protein n=1 Tax=Diacronema lutheri TaxID=2081491 RepID=A0A8J5XJE7_DIALT|nr:hypothetical protein KFE25_009903 [Diacronema lutheri]
MATSDGVLTALMPVSALVSAAALMLGGVGMAPYSAAFSLLWAIKNWARGPLKRDAGLFTFALYLAAVGTRASARWRAGCAFVLAANFGVPALVILAAPAKTTARKLRKGEAWAHVFRAYLGAMCMYWSVVGVLHVRASA